MPTWYPPLYLVSRLVDHGSGNLEVVFQGVPSTLGSLGLGHLKGTSAPCALASASREVGVVSLQSCPARLGARAHPRLQLRTCAVFSCLLLCSGSFLGKQVLATGFIQQTLIEYSLCMPGELGR